ncbi:transglutaminase-like domain-containing protein [Rubripirellula reticaptiva]|uniref:Transglutaminase-like superfamily protein n=1 Tax=Rubripirellula reticaptiva TaxID=2528013 RepID=A0A5C6F6A3_9BACT|nr:transglutaminase-like domain-containing protein [Rubripirellula reticaptiva]TWU57233.1 Transglutaminase-like superfamily protein [Rubripirellula reticaptiva]
MTRFNFADFRTSAIATHKCRQFFGGYLFVLGTVVLIFGCDIPKRPPLVPADVAHLANESANGQSLSEGGALSVDAQSENYELPMGTFSDDWETWDLYTIDGQPVGYNHLTAEGTDEGEVRYRTDNHLYVNQGKSRTLQRMIQTSFETPDGKLLRFESELHVGPIVTRTSGTVDGSQLKIESVRGTAKTNRSIAWSPRDRGLVAIEQSLRTKPMTRKGETRNLRLLLPGQFQIATARLRCSGTASIPLSDQTLAELTEINYEVQVDGQLASYSTIWTKADGEIVRMFSEGINLNSYRTDESTVKSAIVNQNEVTAIPVTGSIERPSEATRIALRVTATSQAAKEQKTARIEPMPGQLVRALDDGTAQILISQKPESATNGFVAFELTPVPEDSAPNAFVDSNASLVARYATATLGTRELTPRETAIELARAVGTSIADRDRPGGLVKASEVFNQGLGDSTGRAILLAAMLRSRKIPARVAIGLKYANSPPDRMTYHMWTLAYIDDQWIPLDATAEGLAPVDRLMLATSNLSGGNEYNAFIPFLNATSRINIEILKATY